MEHIVPDRLPPGPDAMQITGFDLEMSLAGGRERTRAEWDTLLSATGFRVERVRPVVGRIHVLVACLAA